MTNNGFDIGEITRLAKTLLDKEIKSFLLEDVHNVVREAYDKHPEDTIIKQFAFVIERKAMKATKGDRITQGEMEGIYNDLACLSSTSKFKEVLGCLLPTSIIRQANDNGFVKANRIDAEDKQITNADIVDQNIVNAIGAVFGGSLDAARTFDTPAANQGLECVKAELKSFGFKDAKVEIMGGNPNTIVYAANFDTVKGKVSVAIPTELAEGRVLFPSTFVSDDHLEELTAANLRGFIEKKATTQDFSIPSVKDTLSAIGIITGRIKNVSEAGYNDVKAIFGRGIEDETKVKDAGVMIGSNTNDTFVEPYKKVAVERFDVSMDEGNVYPEQKVEMPKVLAHLAHDFENSVMESASVFGAESIRNGKEFVSKALGAAGFKNAQVKYGSESQDSVVYVAAINTPRGLAQIEIPVEMKVWGKRYVPLAPAYFAYDGVVEDFTAAKLQSFASNVPNPSFGSRVCASSFSFMTLPELKQEIVKSASVNDYDACEEALSEIQNKYSDEDFRNAVADYQYVLKLKAGVENQNKAGEKHCSREIPAGKGSVMARCGHMLVTMDKVVIGEDGICRLKSSIERDRLNPIEDGGCSISSAKIFMA